MKMAAFTLKGLTSAQVFGCAEKGASVHQDGKAAVKNREALLRLMEKSLKGLSIDIIVNACYTPKTNINFNLSNQKKIFWLFVLNKMCLF